LVLGALADGPTVVQGALRSRDTTLMAAGLAALGFPVDVSGPDWTLAGPLAASGRAPGPCSVDVGNAGTVARFLPPLAALRTGATTFDGDPRVRERPVGPLIEALRTLGAAVDDGGRGALPLTVHGSGRLTGGTVSLDASSSSQLVSALLLVGPRTDDGVDVRHDGPRLPSRPHLDMTVGMLRDFGAVVDDTRADRWRVEPGRLAGRVVTVEPDLSGAAPFAAAAAATGGRVVVAGWPAVTAQPGRALPDLLAAMGCTCTHTSEGLQVDGPATLTGIDADLADAPELTPVLAALAALATTPSTLRGVAHLRLQETDRLAALVREIRGLGGDADELADGLTIRPSPLRGGIWRCYDDHRMAMAGAVVGLAVDGVVLDDVATTAKTMPDFADRWTALAGTGS
jgi:3-phosphoshikimate 1-carboxyvinyltransferase